MLLFITFLHVVLCFVLILIIILQPGKGSDVSAAFGGGGSSTVFGPRGPTSLLSKATTGVAVLFMTTSIVLALNSDKARTSSGSIEDQIRAQEEAADVAEHRATDVDWQRLLEEAEEASEGLPLPEGLPEGTLDSPEQGSSDPLEVPADGTEDPSTESP